MNPPLLELGGSGPPIHIAPANGFPLETYAPIFTSLLARFRLVCVPPRALWSGIGAPPAQPGTWESLADDLVTGWGAHRLGPVIAVGHSFGAVASLRAAIRPPAEVRALVLLDPTIFPRAVMREIGAQRRSGGPARFPLVEAALKRRRHFASLDEAFRYWRAKPLFHDWSDEALRTYASGLLRRDQSRGGWTLAWPPEWEAWYYQSFPADTWGAVARLPRDLPALVIGGERSDTFTPAAAAELREAMPWATHLSLPGAGHLFPQSHPDRLRPVLEDWIARVG